MDLVQYKSATQPVLRKAVQPVPSVTTKISGAPVAPLNFCIFKKSYICPLEDKKPKRNAFY
jgi:hypothetical protein